MITAKRKPLKVFLVFVSGVLLSLMLYISAAAILVRKTGLRKHVLESQQSTAAYANVTNSFRSMNMWRDFVVLPIIGCVIGAYAGFLQRKKSAILAVSCLLPLLAIEIGGEPVRTWSLAWDARYFGLRAMELVLAAFVAICLSRLLDKRSESQPPS